jgi:beta-1,4-mannooligosaccharide/beta-1,4-mannosyl-N-acetylglucosamine phosphorylase
MSAGFISRFSGNPILTRKDVPYPAELVFNAGVIKRRGAYYMIFRNDRGHIEHTLFESYELGMAYSDDGLAWKVHEKPVFAVPDSRDPEIQRFYDVRLTEIEDEVYATMAVETKHGLRAGIGTTRNFVDLRMLSMSLPDNRNLVLYPERINGKFVRMERPFTLSNNRCYDIWMSESPDMRHWGNSRLVVRHEDIPDATAKMGPGTPPIRTEKGWLSLIHAVDFDPSRGKNGYEPLWQKRYCAYAMLQDIRDPSKVLGISREPVLAPEAEYEISGGFRNNVIFPMALIDEGDGTARIYYGAADTVMCMATAPIDALIGASLA